MQIEWSVLDACLCCDNNLLLGKFSKIFEFKCKRTVETVLEIMR